MMEETNDEQPEMVSHEEAVLVEREVTQNLSSPVAAGLSPSYAQLHRTVSAPSPLPAFLNKDLPSKTTSPPVSVSTPYLPSPSLEYAAVSTKAPESPQIPHEGKTKSPEPSAESHTSASGSGYGLFGWISGSSLVNKVVEKTKSSMETVITTLDPGMKELIYSGGDINIAVTSTKDNKVVPVREAFLKVFKKATVVGKESQTTTAAQPVGFTGGLKGAEERIANLRKSSSILEDQTVVSVEGFIVEILPDRWLELSCLLLKDPAHGIELQTFSQPTLIPTEYILTAQDRTPSDYPLRVSTVSYGSPILTQEASYSSPILTQEASYSSPIQTQEASYSSPVLTQEASYESLTPVSFS